MRTSQRSLLKTFIVAVDEQRGVLNVICPSCDGRFAVARKWRDATSESAPCPYCFKTAWRVSLT